MPGEWDPAIPPLVTLAEILTSNSVGAQLFFRGCNPDNNRGSNFITKKKLCLVLPEKEIINHRNYKFSHLGLLKFLQSVIIMGYLI